MRTLHDVHEGSSEVGRPFWAAMMDGRIDIPRCRSCHTCFFYPRRHCPNCQSTDVGWIAASGRGSVFAVTVVHIPFQGMAAEDVPMATGFVDLEEGVRIAARFVADEPPAIGDAVEASFRPGYGGFPVFVPAKAAA
jgi:uncharacterized protein